jgi:hypothetical protein
VYSDADPYYDDCSKGGPTDKSKTIAQTGKNAGDLLNVKGITWGWFQGGFDDCAAKHVDIAYDQSVGINLATDPNTTGDYNPITSRSSISPKPPIRITFDPAASLQSARPTRRTTSTI